MVELFNITTKTGHSLGRSMIFESVEDAIKSADTALYTDYLICELATGRLIDWNEIHVREPEFEYYSEEDQMWHRIMPGL